MILTEARLKAILDDILTNTDTEKHLPIYYMGVEIDTAEQFIELYEKQINSHD